MDKISCSISHAKFFENVHKVAQDGYGVELIGIAFESSKKLGEWQKDNITKINNLIGNYKVPIYYHGYFYDVDIGLSDKYMREYSLISLLNELDFCHEIGAGECIIHNAFKPGIVDVYYDFWLLNYKKSLDILLRKAEKLKVKLCLENFWDKDIKFTQEIMKEFESDYLGLCVDIGHINAFGNKNFAEWMEAFQNKIVVFHVTDNNGINDDHLAIGEGSIDYNKFFSIYKELNLTSRINIETYNSDEPFQKSLLWMKENLH